MHQGNRDRAGVGGSSLVCLNGMSCVEVLNLMKA